MKDDSVLIIYSGWLGDLVWIIPTIHALKSAFHSVSIVVSKVQAPLAEVMTNGLVAKVYVDTSSDRLRSAQNVRREARAAGTNTFIDLKGRWKTGIYIPWEGGLNVWLPHRQDAREYALSWLVHPLASRLPAREDGHMVDAYLSGLSGLNVQNGPISFKLPFRDETIEAAETIIEQENLRDTKSVSLNLGSAQYSKIWPPEKMVQLAQILKHDMGCKVALMGARTFSPNSNYDMRISKEFFQNDLTVNLVEKTDLAVDAYLLSSDAFSVSVGNDSFAGHMAGSASETHSETKGAIQANDDRWYKANKTVSLFGPTNPVFCKPYDPTGAFNTVVTPQSYPTSCVYDKTSHTCPHYGDRYCSDQAHCMQHITVEQVAAAIADNL
jgi:ADP-heptose:LPS heptosyltransferase